MKPIWISMLLSPGMPASGRQALPPAGLAQPGERQTGFRERKANRPGQSLVEFVLVMPILLLILIAGASIGIGTYQAHIASDAVRQANINALAMADLDTAVNAGALLGYMTASGTGGTIKMGAVVDNTQVTALDSFNSIVVGTKTFVPAAAFIPGFDIRVGQVIKRGLVESASTGGAQSRPYGTAWVPGGTPVIPPWEGGPAPAYIGGAPAAPVDPAAAPADPAAPPAAPAP